MKMNKLAIIMGLAAILAGTVYAANETKAAGNTYPIPVVAPAPTNPAAEASASPVPTTGPSKQYQLINKHTSGDYEYTIIDGVNRFASLIKINNYGEDIVIPDAIDGYKIVGIGIPYDKEDDYEYLDKNEYLDMVDIFCPPSTTMPYISDDIVYGINYGRRCVVDMKDKKVKSLKIPENVITIYEDAFGAMYSLQKLELPTTLREIRSGNFNYSNSLKELTINSYLTVKESFYGLYLDKLTVCGNLNCGSYDEEEKRAGIIGCTKKMILDEKSFASCVYDKMYLTMEDFGVKELVIPEKTGKVKALNIESADIDTIKLGNPNLKIEGRGLDSAINKVTSTIMNIKGKYNKKTKKYTYSWKKINCNIKSEKTEEKIRNVNVKYTIYRKNSKGKYVKLSTTTKTKYESKKKYNIKVERVITVERYKSNNSKWMV